MGVLSKLSFVAASNPPMAMLDNASGNVLSRAALIHEFKETMTRCGVKSEN
jgi:hypothetical protein